MSSLADFLLEEVNDILSLPLQIGGWIGTLDDDPHTQKDQTLEHKALVQALERVGRILPAKSFAKDIITRILASKHLWRDWTQPKGDVLERTKNILFLLTQRLPAREVLLYKKALFHIAKSTAMAAAEDKTPDEPLREVMVAGVIFDLFNKILENLSAKNIPANVSQKEREALKKLRALLQDGGF